MNTPPTPDQVKNEIVALADEVTKAGVVSASRLGSLIDRLEYGQRTASVDGVRVASTLRELAGKVGGGVSRLGLAQELRALMGPIAVVASARPKTASQEPFAAPQGAPVTTAGPMPTPSVSEMAGRLADQHTGRFERGKPADPTKHMSPEDKDTWWEMHDKYKDTLKAGETKTALDVSPGKLAKLREAYKWLHEAQKWALRAHTTPPKIDQSDPGDYVPVCLRMGVEELSAADTQHRTTLMALAKAILATKDERTDAWSDAINNYHSPSSADEVGFQKAVTHMPVKALGEAIRAGDAAGADLQLSALFATMAVALKKWDCQQGVTLAKKLADDYASAGV